MIEGSPGRAHQKTYERRMKGGKEGRKITIHTHTHSLTTHRHICI